MALNPQYLDKICTFIIKADTIYKYKSKIVEFMKRKLDNLTGRPMTKNERKDLREIVFGKISSNQWNQ